jgi:hypothetical protein
MGCSVEFGGCLSAPTAFQPQALPPDDPMKTSILCCALVASISLVLPEAARSHGGIWIGPGDTVPPGGGGGSGPPSPGPSDPGSPGPSRPSSPRRPGDPPAPGPSQPSGPSTPGLGAGVDLTDWRFWWGFNKSPYINLKGHLYRAGSVTGSDDFFLGAGQSERSKSSLRPSKETIRQVIVPALLAALEHERHNDIVTGALVALSKIGDEPGEDGHSLIQDAIEKRLDDPSQEIAETAAVSLGILRSQGAVEILTDLALDTERGRALVGRSAGVHYRTRAFAVYGLGEVGQFHSSPVVREDIVAALWRIASAPRSSTRDLKVAALISMGIVPLEVRDPLAEFGGRSERRAGRNGAPTCRREQIDYLLNYFQDEKNSARPVLVRAHIPRSLAKLLEGLPSEKPRVVSALLPYVTRRGHVGQRELRQSAALCFGQLGDLDLDPEDVALRKALMESAGNADKQVQYFSLMALGRIGGRPGSGADSLAAEAPVRRFLLNKLARGKNARPWAALALGVMQRGLEDAGRQQSESALSALRLHLKESRSPSDVGSCAIALGIARDNRAESLLLDKLEQSSGDELRGQIAIGLGLSNSLAALAPIQEVVANSNHRGVLLKQAAIALGLLGDKRIVKRLVAQLKQAKTLTTQASIAAALGLVGDANSVVPLVDMLGDENLTGAARGFAAVALGLVADKQDLPWNSVFSIDINYRATTSTLTGQNGTGLLDIL